MHWRNRRRVRRRASGRTFAYNLRFPGQVFDGQAGLHQNGFRDYDPAVGRYAEADPIGQRFYFTLSSVSAASLKHRGYWNHLYNYVDNHPTLLKDPTGLGTLDWLWDLLKEKTPEEVTTKSVSAALAVLCITKNCGKTRGSLELYGDCASILNDWVKQQGTGVIAAISSITGDGGQAVVSECAELCEKGIKTGSCCKGEK